MLDQIDPQRKDPDMDLPPQGIELYWKDGTATGVFYCSKCRTVFTDKQAADGCHGERKCACGSLLERNYQSQCDDCRNKEWQERQIKTEFDRYTNARKVTAEEYLAALKMLGVEQMVFDGDKYHESLEEFIGGLDDEEEKRLPYIWACRDIGVRKATTEDITCSLLENMWEDADESDLNGMDELQAAIDKFNEANAGIHVWEPDYSTAILIGDTE